MISMGWIVRPGGDGSVKAAANRGFGRARRKGAILPLAAGLGLALLLVFQVHGQPVERNIPAAPVSPPVTITPPPLGSIKDDRSLGARLSTIVLLGPTSPIEAPAAPGIETWAIKRLNSNAVRGALKRFIGRPISRKLIGQIEAVIVREYRYQGFPFVEVSTPEQEITKGVLQFRVVEFRVGKLTVTGAKGRRADNIRGQIRTRPGEEIDSRRLGQDLDWLNRYPYRTIAPTFSAGAALGLTDLDLAATWHRPWSVNAGYANSGSALSGWDRYFVGASVSGHLLTDTYLSAQLTGSPDFWATRWKPFDNDHPRYESAAGRLVAATGPRQDVELTLNAVETNEPVIPFVVRQDTVEGTLGYRSALSNIVPLPGDIVGGVEISRQSRHTFFGGVNVLNETVDIFQLYGEWTNRWTDPLGGLTIDATVHGSPSRFDQFNTDARFADFTNGRVMRASYVYGDLNMVRQTLLPKGFSLIDQFSGQYAGRPIPDSQQLELGGPSGVRGYSLDDGAWDDGVYLRNELHAPVLSLFRRGPLPASLDAMVFADVGYGHDDGIRDEARMASIGVGANLQLGALVVASVDYAHPMTDAKVTRTGEDHVDVRLTFAY